MTNLARRTRIRPPRRRTSADARRLREAYVRVVNAALEQGRDDLARELADEYARERAELPHAA